MGVYIKLWRARHILHSILEDQGQTAPPDTQYTTGLKVETALKAVHKDFIQPTDSS